jgi:hypothetical protein
MTIVSKRGEEEGLDKKGVFVAAFQKDPQVHRDYNYRSAALSHTVPE